MKYPVPSDYVAALQRPDQAFSDPELASGEVATTPLGLPRVITGAYAAVFRVQVGAQTYAVRCFLTGAPDRRRRYRAVGQRLVQHPVAAVVPFDYQAAGIRVGEAAYPLVRMPWIEAATLEAFAEARLHDRRALLGLREAWRRVMAELAGAAMAHGDLQHGNVFVEEMDGDIVLRLVDHDAMWVPALAGRPSPEVGHRNFQHPDRTAEDEGPWLDRFPALVVYVALTALAEAPELWERFNTGENLLFRAEDFLDPDASPLFAELQAREQLAPLAEVLRRCCYLEPPAVPSLEDALAGAVPAPARLRVARRRRDEPARRPRQGLAAWALPVVVVALLTAGVLIVTGWWVSAVGVLLVAGAVLAGGTVAAYRRLPAVRRRRRLRSEATVLEKWIEDLEDQLDALRREREAFLRSAARMRTERLDELQAAALHARLKHHFVGEMGTDEEVGHRAVIRLKAAGVRNAFHATPERVERAKDLSAAQRAAVAGWREGLVDRYADDLPRELSPAEEQRLRRMLERRLATFGADMARLQAKIALQRQELARVEAQIDRLPETTRASYLAYLLRLRSDPGG